MERPYPDKLSSRKAICNTASRYVWGFSSYLTRTGLILEAVWMAFCFVSYPRLSLRSKMNIREHLRTAGVMRLALDCSESVRDDVGSETSYLSEQVLKKNKKVERVENIVSKSTV
ncbi:hypothetical protein F4804DRAFT_210437 [Jackrogersella minutella]|nr:hypothetical protein F4804DRAFT_210437 [Jackrogersella minutella]